MVVIIHGDINQGKTSTLLSLYYKNRDGDGFVLLKKMIENQHNGYQIMHLSTGRVIPFAVPSKSKPDHWNEVCQLGKYSFHSKGFLYGQYIVEKMLETGVSPFYIDEAGQLEISGKGFHYVIQRLMSLNKPLYLSVRNKFVGDVIKCFNIKNYQLIEASVQS
ncbi:MAG: hypothetical protein MJB14_00795 [Spirochaetes bacterium]|nr:hypothetical protein [Spirochaetota bacterium]